MRRQLRLKAEKAGSCLGTTEDIDSMNRAYVETRKPAATASNVSEASRSLWMGVAAVFAKPLKESVTTDVAIIGTGICGTSLAFELTKKGVAVVMLDRREIARGMSSR